VVYGADGLKEIEAAASRHLLIEEDHSVWLALEKDESVVSMCSGLDREALLFEEENMRGETLDLVVDPQNASWPWHAVNIDLK
jgi:hypothetical protein